MEYIKLIDIKNLETWFGRLDDNSYVSDTPCHSYNGDTNESKLHLYPSEIMRVTYDELIKDNRYKVYTITKEEYWSQANELMIKYYDEEIKKYEKIIEDLLTRKIEIMNNIQLEIF